MNFSLCLQIIGVTISKGKQSSPTTRNGGAWRERRYSSYSFLTLVSVRPRPRFTPRERTPGTRCTGGWVGPRVGLDTEVGEKILLPCWGSNTDRPVVQSVVRHYTDWATPSPIRKGEWTNICLHFECVRAYRQTYLLFLWDGPTRRPFMIYCASSHFLFVHQNSLAITSRDL
jgi:hypothetical protein